MNTKLLRFIVQVFQQVLSETNHYQLQLAIPVLAFYMYDKCFSEHIHRNIYM